MEIVKTPNLETLNRNIKDDFYIVPNLKFDIDKLRADLNTVLKKKKFNTLGIKNFGAISLNQVPGDKKVLQRATMLEAHTGPYPMKKVKKL